MKSIKVINNIFRFYPLGLLLLLIIQVVCIVLSLGGNFPKPYITNINPMLDIFIILFMTLSFAGLIISIAYPIAKIIDINKNKENIKQNTIDIIIFATGIVAFCSFVNILNTVTHYIDWMID